MKFMWIKIFLHWFTISLSTEVNDSVIMLSKVLYLYCTSFLSLISHKILSFPFIHTRNIYSAPIMGQAQF